jgi:hypothetical protein
LTPDSYSDRADLPGVLPPGCAIIGAASRTYPPRWDTWGRFIQPLMSVIPTLTVTDARKARGGARVGLYEGDTSQRTHEQLIPEN